jgi:phosphatidyl-myo-inositol dimannoside synthase
VIYNHFIHSEFGDQALVLAPTHFSSASHDASLPYEVIRSKYGAPYDVTPSRWLRLFNGIAFFFQTLWIIKTRGVKVLHMGNLAKLALSGVLLAKLTGVKTILTVHGEELSTIPGRENFMWGGPGRLMDQLMIFCARRFDLVLSSSRSTQQILERLRFNPQRIAVITPGVDETKLNHTEPQKPKGLPDNIAQEPWVLCVGRLIARKGQDTILLTLPKLLEYFPKLQVVIAGLGPKEKLLKSLVTLNKLENHVTFLPEANSSEIAWLYANCTLFCMPNRTLDNGDSEGYGIVFLEAGAHRKAVIGGRSGGAVEAIDHGVTGLLVTPNDPDELCNTLKILLQDPHMRQRLGEAGFIKAQSNGWQEKSRAFKTLVKNLLAQNKASHLRFLADDQIQ